MLRNQRLGAPKALVEWEGEGAFVGDFSIGLVPSLSDRRGDLMKRGRGWDPDGRDRCLRTFAPPTNSLEAVTVFSVLIMLAPLSNDIVLNRPKDFLLGDGGSSLLFLRNPDIIWPMPRFGIRELRDMSGLCFPKETGSSGGCLIVVFHSIRSHLKMALL